MVLSRADRRQVNLGAVGTAQPAQAEPAPIGTELEGKEDEHDRDQAKVAPKNHGRQRRCARKPKEADDLRLGQLAVHLEE